MYLCKCTLQHVAAASINFTFESEFSKGTGTDLRRFTGISFALNDTQKQRFDIDFNCQKLHIIKVLESDTIFISAVQASLILIHKSKSYCCVKSEFY